MQKNIRRVLQYVLTGVVLAGVITAGIWYAPVWQQWLSHEPHPAAGEQRPAATGAVRVPGKPSTLQVPTDVLERLRIYTALVESCPQGKPLELPGTLSLDADRLAHVRARFAGEVVELGVSTRTSRPVSIGDPVQQGDLLAVVWSRDLGEKKSELVDGLSQLWLDEEIANRLEKSFADGAVPERSLREAERKVESDRIAVERALRTLRVWRVSKEEIDELRAEAKQVANKERPDREELAAQWARVELCAPFDGIILERNVARGDLVDTATDLFKIADLSRLRVLAHAYEEDLPDLDTLTATQRRWKVRVGSGEGVETRDGEFDHIGHLIDPNQHTALVMGWVDNANGRLRAGQFITSAVELPASSGEVLIPGAAVLEKGKQAVVFVQADERTPQFTRLAVAVARRTPHGVVIRNELTPEEQAAGVQPLPAGQRVVSSGVVALDAVLAHD